VYSPARIGSIAALCLTLALAATVWPARAHDDRTERSEAREERRIREQERRQRDAQRELERQAERDLRGGSGKSSTDSGSSRDDDDDHEDDREDERIASRAARIEVTADAEGRERRRDEILMVGRDDALQAVRAAGYAIVGERALTAFAETLVRIRVPGGVSIEQAIVDLRAVAPDAEFAPHHLFRASEAESERTVAAASGASAHRVRIGVIDTGADGSWPALTSAIVRTEGFAEGGYTPRSHGTLVAEVAATRGAQLHVGDVFGVDSENRLVASAEAIAAAIHWLVADRVRVINISIEGPDNLVLAHVIKRALAADTMIVAAAGNGGPAAKPVYPAAYPGVIAVTAIDDTGRVYRRANQGGYIAFAARGVRVTSSYPFAKEKSVSGTSFAAPIVAVALATKLRDTAGGGLSAVAALQREAHDLGDPGRDAIYGWGTIEISN
jgi:hypothetical protein